MSIKITILGSGTSSGVPTIGCQCPTCLSTDTKDKRLRSSILIQKDDINIIIDSTPDFRMQTLKHNICSLDGIIYTHPHFDHIGGFDDIRAFNFVMRKPIDLYLNDYTLERLSKTFYYAFEEPEQLGGGVPLFNTHMIEDAKFSIRGIEFTPIFMKHGIIPVIGYRINSLAYCTDVNFIPDSELDKFNDLEYLIIGGLRYHTHPTHFTIDQAIEFANKVKAKNVIITHIAHQVKHSEAILPDNARLAFDDMVIEID